MKGPSALASFVMGVSVGVIILWFALEAVTSNKYHQEGYTQGVKDCMAGEAKAIITADTIVAYPSR